ncbi:MAG: choice-of-anchor V domain-containing protein [Planctomycetota bacterium]|nr:choice-of-anchor V domain-containing protein [Planctomycetota bacterium]
MLASPLAKPLSLAGAAVLWIGIPTMTPWSSGTWTTSPGSASGASCAGCHFQAGPSIDSSRTSLVADAGVHALSAGQSISVTTSLDASGANQTHGGFLCETDAGTFTAGANTQTGSTNNTIAVSHVNSSARSWTYTFNAPATPGLVELTAAGMSPNGDGLAFSVAGDYMSFSGYDKTATSATPLRLYVLPNGVTNVGTACPDAYGNTSVLGANEEPNPGDAGFELRLHGAAPGEAAFLWGAIGANNAFSQSLDGLGVTGCTSYIQSVDATQVATTSAGSAQRADGSVAFALPIPNNPALIGTTYHFQAGYCDPSVNSGFSGLPNGSPVLAAARSLDLSLTNALEVTVQ